MREILFRGKTNTKNEWVYGDLIQGENTYISTKELFDSAVVGLNGHMSTFVEIVDKNTIGQYTGLTDKNDKKIFEGDIIRQRNYGSIKKNTYDNKREKTSHKRFLIKKNGAVFDNEDDYHTDIINVITFEDCRFLPFADDNFEWGNFNTNLPYEVIGNIYDNSELLEVQDATN